MAKRRRLEAPDLTDLADLEAGFAAKPVPDRMGVVAPIAQVAGQAAKEAEQGDRISAAEAESWRRAREEGRVIERLPIEQIVTEHLVRDRMTHAQEEFDELKASIRANGVRTPIEVVPLEQGWGLVSGWRRVAALQSLRAEGAGGFETVPAIVRPGGEAAGAYLAMVEENEVRAQLTPYERGRIAVVAAGQGAFADVDRAIAGLYAAASKAKRSKIRSFALVHEEFGDLLTFPTELSEKAGLRLAAAIRNGFAAKLRAALGAGIGSTASEEWSLLEAVLAEHEAEGRPDRGRGGRPRATLPRRRREGEVALANGITLERISEDDGFAIKVRGPGLDVELMDTVMIEMKRLLEAV